MTDHQPATDRADRILDAAGALLLRHGYRKVTVEDVATQARIGKGTVYLHWRTKRLVFEALLLRESIWMLEELLDGLRQDPAEIRPHRFVRAGFLATVRRPLLRALSTGDMELLDTLTEHPLRSHELLAIERFYEVTTRHGLLRDDFPNLAYALNATVLGFYLNDRVDPAELDLEARADALARTVRHAFEPAAEPDPQTLTTAAAETIALLAGLIPPYRKWIYTGDQVQEPG